MLSVFGFGCFGFSGMLDALGFSDIDRGSSFGLDCFRLLIQRCKRRVEIGNLFDQGIDLPDESEDSPTNGCGVGTGVSRC
jgi:hypothetical protein